MIEKIIFLEGIEPVNIYGVENSRLQSLKDFYPKLKIVARGDEIKVKGEEQLINEFEKIYFTQFFIVGNNFPVYFDKFLLSEQ